MSPLSSFHFQDVWSLITWKNPLPTHWPPTFQNWPPSFSLSLLAFPSPLRPSLYYALILELTWWAWAIYLYQYTKFHKSIILCYTYLWIKESCDLYCTNAQHCNAHYNAFMLIFMNLYLWKHICTMSYTRLLKDPCHILRLRESREQHHGTETSWCQAW